MKKVYRRAVILCALCANEYSEEGKNIHNINKSLYHQRVKEFPIRIKCNDRWDFSRKTRGSNLTQLC